MKKKSIHILLVDDHKLFRKAIMELISKFTFVSKLYEAANGKEALTILTDNPIDLVLLDIQMPEMGGIETLKQIRGEGRQAKVVMS